MAADRAPDRDGLMADIVIIGGGISGLTLALSLHELGIGCRIYEGAPAFQRLGVGLNLHPHGVRELTQLGLQPALAQHAGNNGKGGFAGGETGAHAFLYSTCHSRVSGNLT